MYKINPAWDAYNKVNNEGGEGYNPHSKYVPTPTSNAGGARMICGKLRTRADAIKFAKNCLSGDQKDHYLAQVAAVFGGAA